MCQYSAEREHSGEAGSPASGLAEGAGRTAFGATGLRMTDKPRRLAVAEAAVEVVRPLLGDLTNPDLVRELVAEDCVYVSLNFADPDLKRIMPWCGTGRGSLALLQTFTDLSRFWTIDNFEILDIFGSDSRAGRAVTAPAER
jgi:hypothetical protein